MIIIQHLSLRKPDVVNDSKFANKKKWVVVTKQQMFSTKIYVK